VCQGQLACPCKVAIGLKNRGRRAAPATHYASHRKFFNNPTGPNGMSPFTSHFPAGAGVGQADA